MTAAQNNIRHSPTEPAFSFRLSYNINTHEHLRHFYFNPAILTLTEPTDKNRLECSGVRVETEGKMSLTLNELRKETRCELQDIAADKGREKRPLKS